MPLEREQQMMIVNAFCEAAATLRDAAQESYAAACELRRPCVQFKPRLFIDASRWCALFGENLQDGVAGFGESPDAAMWDFDRSWHVKLLVPPSGQSSHESNVSKLGIVH